MTGPGVSRRTAMAVRLVIASRHPLSIPPVSAPGIMGHSISPRTAMDRRAVPANAVDAASAWIESRVCASAVECA
jgi:hypothetical protein